MVVQQHTIRLNLEGDTFNPEIYRISNDPKISITNWFKASDNEEYIKLKAELFFVDSNSAAIYLTVTPIKPTERNKPVTVEFKIPAATNNEKWTNSGKEINVTNNIKISVLLSFTPTSSDSFDGTKSSMRCFTTDKGFIKNYSSKLLGVSTVVISFDSSEL